MMLRLHKELHDTVSGFESKLETDLRAISERLEAKTETIAYLLKEANNDMAKAVTDFGSQITALNGRFDATTSSLRQENTKLHERIFALKALYEMRRLRRDIDRFIVLLERPLKQPKENREWGDWSKRFGKFGRAMYKFSTIAVF
jgi:hypothetical protein